MEKLFATYIGEIKAKECLIHMLCNGMQSFQGLLPFELVLRHDLDEWPDRQMQLPEKCSAGRHERITPAFAVHVTDCPRLMVYSIF